MPSKMPSGQPNDYIQQVLVNTALKFERNARNKNPQKQSLLCTIVWDNENKHERWKHGTEPY